MRLGPAGDDPSRDIAPLAGGHSQGRPAFGVAITAAPEDALLTGLGAAFRSRAAFGLSLSLSLAGCLFCSWRFPSEKPASGVGRGSGGHSRRLDGRSMWRQRSLDSAESAICKQPDHGNMSAEA